MREGIGFVLVVVCRAVATQQEIFAKACSISEHLPPAIRDEVEPLIGWAAYNVGMARTGIGVIESVATPQGWSQLEALLDLDTRVITEIGALCSTAAVAMTSLDLTAAATLRLWGLRPAGSREFDMGSLQDGAVKDQLKTIKLTSSLDAWKRETLGSNDWALLKRCRDQVVHRNPKQNVFAHAGPVDRYRSTEVIIGRRDHPVGDLVRQFAAFGERRLFAFCDAVAADFPT